MVLQAKDQAADRPDGQPAVPEAITPEDEENERLAVLDEYAPHSLEDDRELNAISDFAAKLCEAPVAFVSLVEEERQRFIARKGAETRETPRELSFCAHAMLLRDVMEVHDASRDPRFADNELVTGPPHVRFYAGQPLISEDGAPLGALCVIDTVARPHGLTQLQKQGMAVLGQAVMRRLRSRREELAADRELRESEARFETIADTIPDIVWSAEHGGAVDFYNNRWYEFTGMAADAEQPAAIDLIHPDDREAMLTGWEKARDAGEPLEIEARLRRADGEYRWMISRAVPMRAPDGAIIRWFGSLTDIDSARRLSENRDLLARELSHRIKNIFAVVSGLISLAARKHPDHADFAADLIEVIRALGRAHDYVRPAGGRHRNRLHGMLGDLFSPYREGDLDRVTIRGDDCEIGARAATPLALVFHELATNSAKYGALSAEGGQVELTIGDGGDTIDLVWRERGGPPPRQEIAEGFGSRLVAMSINGQLGGSWDRRLEPAGLVCQLTVSKAAITP